MKGAELAATAVERYWAAVRAAATRALGHDLETGTTVVPAADREGSDIAVVYPGTEFTVIWCSPHLAPRLDQLNNPNPLTVEEFVSACLPLGGTHLADGTQRVLANAVAVPDIDPRLVAGLDRTAPDDIELIRRFIQECSDEEIDEAEIELDELDPAIVVILAEDRQIAAFASGRPWMFDPQFDDIGVLTHPDHRGKGYGSTVVAALAERQQEADRIMFYNCDVENEASNRLAERVGFELVANVAGVTFAGWS